jgi:hypothetical protein
MTHAEFSALVSGLTSPVVLLEGTRDLAADQVPLLTELAARLAREFPDVRFRTGNAKGSDEAFAAGVASVDANRLEFVLPYAGHRSKQRPAESVANSIDDLPMKDVQDVVDATVAASPQYERVAVNYRTRKTHPRQKATAQLILRDTLKVTGTEDMPPPVAGIFQINTDNPDRGGTGHTMRVCRAQGVPVIIQENWMEWFR